MSDSLEAIAEKMIGGQRGILAADESTGTCTKRFEQVGIEVTEENRRLYRQMLFKAPELEGRIGGVILFDETFRQKTDEGMTIPEYLASRNIVPGIKVDQGTKDLDGCPGEKHTAGLDGLPARLTEYAKLGARFAKWRATIVIDVAKGLPTDKAIQTNAEELAKYAKMCQDAGIVPIVEPEVLINGPHTIEECDERSKKAFHAVFDALKAHGVRLTGMVLKPSMIIAGNECPTQASVEEVADMTVAALKECVPADVPGIAFLSGGQTDIQSTENLNAMNARHKDLPWRLTFSYGRALQQPALKVYAEDPANNVEAAQAELTHRSEMNSLASVGKYDAGMEK